MFLPATLVTLEIVHYLKTLGDLESWWQKKINQCHQVTRTLRYTKYI
jgi:hypothetical protein